jgi:multidrug resistance efflux pump
MLNLSPDNINNIDQKGLKALHRVEQKKSSHKLLKVIYAFFIIFFLILFLPWTQNIRSKGSLTTLRPEQKPQTINTIIPGRIEKWFVKDGDIVKKGDTILFLSEVKNDYLDTNLVGRTQKQLKTKELSVVSYTDKIQSLDNRIDALIESAGLKLQQAKIKLTQTNLKLKSDSIEYQTAQINYKVAEDQYERTEKLYKDGLKSKTDLEARKVAMQRAEANQIGAQQKYLQSKNDIIDARVELNSIQAKYRDEVSKAESDKFTALSSMYDAEVDVTKMQGQLVNYSVRNGMYYILAPQDGVVTAVLSGGIGETVKEGQAIATIMPANYDLAIEMYVRPVDLPLVQKGQKVRIQFDGWPAVVFSGWPNSSFGTFGGEVFAIDNFASPDGTFRVLVAPDKNDRKWPEQLRVGGGSNSMLLLNNVPIGYEFWRQINGFPPDFYQKKTTDIKAKK